MRVLVVLAALFSVVYCGFITYHGGSGGHENHKATSFQSIHIEHFHPVPTYIKKEHPHLLEHPIPKGQSISNVKIHHGSKHDPGYAIITRSNDIHGHDHDSSHEGIFVTGGHGGHGGNDEVQSSHEHLHLHETNLGGQEELSNEAVGGYEVQDHGHEYAQYQGSISQDHENHDHIHSLSQEDYNTALNHYHIAAGGDSHLIGGHQAYAPPAAAGLGYYGKS